jgi:hypothetical protein
MKHFIREPCAYKPLTYFDGCRDCSGKDHNKKCYTTIEQLQQHMKAFDELFKKSDGDLEYAVDMLNGEGEIF